jgi:hypothetical protein
MSRPAQGLALPRHAGISAETVFAVVSAAGVSTQLPLVVALVHAASAVNAATRETPTP